MTLVYAYPAAANHITPPGHPERVDRLAAVEKGRSRLKLTRRDAPMAAETDLLLCHPARYSRESNRPSPPKASLS